MTHTAPANGRTLRRGLAPLGVAVSLAFTALLAAPAYAVPPEHLGSDGEQIVIADSVMVVPGAGGQGQLELGIPGSLYSARWAGSTANETHIYRYFEDGTAPTSWDTNATPGISGKVISISTDSNGNVYSLHTPSALPAPATIATWTPDGTFVKSVSLAIPGGVAGQVTAMAVAKDGLNAYVRADWMSPASQNGLWSVDLTSGSVTSYLVGLAQTMNPEQTPWLQVDPVSGAIGMSLDMYALGFIRDPAAPALVTVSTGTEVIHGIDMTQFSSGTIYFTGSWAINKLNVDSWTWEEFLYPGDVDLGELDWFNPYASRWGTDGRLYVSGFEPPWGVLPFDVTTLKSSEIEYTNSSVVTNVCLPESITLNPNLIGDPAPTSVKPVGGELPAGLTLDPDTGTITGTPGSEGTVTLQAENGVTLIEGSNPDTAELTFSSVTEPVAFAKQGAPTIAGTATPGKTLTAETPAWDPEADFTYQWLRDGEPIKGATADTYTLTKADAETLVTVTATGTADCRITAVASATGVEVAAVPVPPVKPEPPVDPKPPVSPTPPPTGPQTVSPGQGLATTGSTGFAWWATAGLLLLAAGGGTLALRRRGQLSGRA